MNSVSDIRILLYFQHPWQSRHLGTYQIDERVHILSGDWALAHIDELVDHYLTLSDFTCCSICVGLALEIDGKNWTGYFGDHLWHVMGWFYGLLRVLTEGPVCETRTFVWEESYLEFRREDDRLFLQDERLCDGEGFEWSPIVVDLSEFAVKLLAAGNIYAALAIEMGKEAESRGFSREELLQRLEGKGDKPHPANDDIELKLGVILRECDGYLAEPLEGARKIIQCHIQLIHLEGVLARLVDILALDPGCQWRDHFQTSLSETRRLRKATFSQEELNQLSGSIISPYGGMGSFSDYGPGIYHSGTGRYTSVPGTEDFDRIAQEVYSTALALRVTPNCDKPLSSG